MIFNDWQQKGIGQEISKSLLWEYDLSNFDWNDMRTLVVKRVIERGWIDDFYAAIKLYGGIENFQNIIKEIPSLSHKDINFVCTVFNLNTQELKCYTRTLLREKLLNS